MEPVSKLYLERVQETARSWDLFVKVLLKDGTMLTLEKSQLNLNTTRLLEGATCSDGLQVGSTYSNSFECTVLNQNKEFTDLDFYLATLWPFVGLDLSGDEDFEYVPLGEFRVLENVKKFSTIPLTSFDNMSRLNVPFRFEHIVFPTNCTTIFHELVQQCNIRVSENVIRELELLPYEINSLPTEDATCRDVLAGLGILLQKNFRFDRQGILETFWYATTGKCTDRTTRVGNSSYGDQMVSITGVYLTDAYGNTFSVGTEEYPVELPSSPIIQGSEMAIPVLEAAFAKMQDLQYRPATITYIGDPAVQAGDILEHRETAVGDLQLPIMKVSYKFAGTSTLECLGPADAMQNQKSATNKKIQQAFDKTARDKAELESRISQTADTILLEVSERYTDKQAYASLGLRVDSINAEVSQQTQELDAVKESITSIRQSADQVAIQVQQVVDNGVSKVTTAAGYTFDASGLIIQKSGEEMQNRLDHTGMYVERSGETILQANNNGVIATDVSVRNYLIVGSHARFETYSDGADSSRTACFHI